MDINPLTFSQDRIIADLVKYFNDMSPEDRTISATAVPLYNVKVAEKADGKIQMVLGSLGVGDVYVGEATFTWVAPRGVALIATPESFFEVSKYIAPIPASDDFQLFKITTAYEEPEILIDSDYVQAKIESNAGGNAADPNFADTTSFKMLTMHSKDAAEVWMANPSYNLSVAEGNQNDRFVRVRPVYSAEQFVFNFPTITRDSYGWAEEYAIFCSMVSIKRLVFDASTRLEFTYNHRDPLTNIAGLSADMINLRLVWSEDGTFGNPSNDRVTGEIDILDIRINPTIIDGTWANAINVEINEYPTDDMQFKRGVNGLFYWTTHGDQLPVDFHMSGLAITMCTKTRNEDSDLAVPDFIQYE